MSPEFEKRFDHKEFRIGDEFRAYINNIIEAEDGTYRIVISDTPPVISGDKVETEEELDLK